MQVKPVKKPPRRPTEADWVRMEEMAENGMTIEQICLALGFSDITFYRHAKKDQSIRERFESARMRGIAFAVGKLRNHIAEGDKSCLMFYLKCRAGWNEQQYIIDKMQAEIEMLKALVGQQGKS